MIRISTALVTFTVALTGQVIQAIPVSTPPAATSRGCIIATPQEVLRVEKSYTVHSTDCSGVANVQLRYGNSRNLQTDKVPVCKAINLASGVCISTPQRAGTGSSLSAINASSAETFTGVLSVRPLFRAPLKQILKQQHVQH
ncbi:hypothetical protein BGZ76_003435 [Entomortierella beljakovae]|nr:hypothetical protein BGZ76_003435 [Entomortierella beljakovae]